MAERRAWLRRPTGWAWAVPLVALLAGLIFGTSGAAAGSGGFRKEATGLPDVIRAKMRENDRLRADQSALQDEVEAAAQASPGNAVLKTLEQRVEQLRVAGGRTPVQGPAVTVTLDDSRLSPERLPEGYTLNDLVVHQQDVQAVVNALWRGGAEAMTIMDQRVISTSAVRCVGNTLILQGRVYSPPYVISALGDQARLRAELQADPAVRIYQEYAMAIGLGYDVSDSSDRTFPRYEGTITPKYAQAVR